MLSGRRTLVRMRAGEAGEILEMDREQMQPAVQTDSELSELLMQAFILCRVSLIRRGE